MRAKKRKRSVDKQLKGLQTMGGRSGKFGAREKPCICRWQGVKMTHSTTIPVPWSLFSISSYCETTPEMLRYGGPFFEKLIFLHNPIT